MYPICVHFKCDKPSVFPMTYNVAWVNAKGHQQALVGRWTRPLVWQCMATIHVLQLQPHCGQHLSQWWHIHLHQAHTTAKWEQHADKHLQLLCQLKQDHNVTGNAETVTWNTPDIDLFILELMDLGVSAELSKNYVISAHLTIPN